MGTEREEWISKRAYEDRVPWNGVARLIIELSGQGREWVNLRLAS